MGWTIGFLFSAGAGNLSFRHRVQTDPGGPTQPPIQWVPVSTSMGVIRPGREADR